MEIRNKKARHNYDVLKVYEAGIVLNGNEIKSIREGRVNFKDSYAAVEKGEMWLYNMHISHYEKGSYQAESPTRPRKLLLKKHEIYRLESRVKEKGLTLVPLRMYINKRGLAKLDLGLAKGKKNYEKRDKISNRDAERELRHFNKNHY